jgi:hypothetical protein
LHDDVLNHNFIVIFLSSFFFFMFTTSDLIARLSKEATIIKHLASKINHEQHLGHQFTPGQRTIKELMTYLAYSPLRQLKVILTGDMSVFADVKELGETFDPQTFDQLIDTQLGEMTQLLESMTDEQWAEMIELFGATETRNSFLIEMFVAQLSAYKMQLFLQLKHAGLSDLGSMNVWRGHDKPAA